MAAFWGLLAFDAVVVLGFGGLATRGHASAVLRRRPKPKGERNAA